MTKDEFKILVKGMKAVYAQATFIPDNDAFNIWYSLLKDLDYKECSAAIQMYMSTEKFPPTVADIRECTRKLHEGTEVSDLEVWGMVMNAIRDSSYHAEERFNELPEIAQLAIGSPQQLRSWGIDGDFNEGVIQSNFLRNYAEVKRKRKEINQLPQSIRTLIESTSQKMIGEKS